MAKKKIRVVVDLSGGCVHEIVHDDPEVELDIVFLGGSDDVSDDLSRESQVKKGYFEGSWIYTTSESTPVGMADAPPTKALGPVFEAVRKYVERP